MTYRLTIKGTAEQAHDALEQHGFYGWEDVRSNPAVILDRDRGVRSIFNEAVVRITSDYDLTVKLNRWFQESEREPPFPAGSLLLWSQERQGANA